MSSKLSTPHLKYPSRESLRIVPKELHTARASFKKLLGKEGHLIMCLTSKLIDSIEAWHVRLWF